MRYQQALRFLLVVGLLALLPLGIAGSLSRTAFAESDDVCDGCIWLPFLSGGEKAPVVDQPFDPSNPQPLGPTPEPTATPIPQNPQPGDNSDVTPAPTPTVSKPVVEVPPPTPEPISTNVPGQYEIWELGTLSLVAEGTTIEMPADGSFPGGTYISGYVLEGQAGSLHGDLVESGAFRLTLNAFKPNADYMLQKGGIYYVQGNWVLIEGDVTAMQLSPRELMRMRHDPNVLRGRLQTELRFNPLEAQQPWSAKFSLPMSTANSTWARGDGTFTMDANGQAYVSMGVNVWKAAK